MSGDPRRAEAAFLLERVADDALDAAAALARWPWTGADAPADAAPAVEALRRFAADADQRDKCPGYGDETRAELRALARRFLAEA